MAKKSRCLFLSQMFVLFIGLIYILRTMQTLRLPYLLLQLQIQRLTLPLLQALPISPRLSLSKSYERFNTNQFLSRTFLTESWLSNKRSFLPRLSHEISESKTIWFRDLILLPTKNALILRRCFGGLQIFQTLMMFSTSSLTQITTTLLSNSIAERYLTVLTS